MTDRASGPSGAKAPAMSAALAAAPPWRREPYRVFFPLGALLAWAGVLHWLLHSVGLLPDYQPVFHSIVQIQGFMMCFAVGFLFTAIPRRTGTAPPAGWQIGLGLAAPIGTTVAAWLQRFALSQFCWLVLVVVLITFAVGRLRSGRAARRPPDSFVWVPLALLMGCVGALLIGAYGLMGPDYFWLHDLGRLLLLQGMFLGLVLGVGGLVLPLLIRNEPPPDGGATPRSRGARLAHLAAAILLVASFWIENSVSLRGGYALRAALILVVLLAVGRIWRWPTVPGWHRWLVWLTAWLIPAGYVLAALFPFEKKAGLHVVFIGGFALRDPRDTGARRVRAHRPGAPVAGPGLRLPLPAGDGAAGADRLRPGALLPVAGRLGGDVPGGDAVLGLARPAARLARGRPGGEAPVSECCGGGGVPHTCPMHPEVRQSGPGACPDCGMALEPVELAAPSFQTEYVCPMCPDVVPGR